MSNKTRIILVDWDQSPLIRSKNIGDKTIQCGIQPFISSIKNHSKESDIEVILVINSNHSNNLVTQKKYEPLLKEFEFITSLHIRDNHAMDIGAYDYGFKISLRENYRGRIMFINSSVSGPHTDSWLKKYEALFSSTPKIGLSGSTVNMIPDKMSRASSLEHVQSWLLYSDMAILKECFGDSLLLEKADYSTKQNIIYNGEIGISQMIINHGYGINCMAFPKLHYFRGNPWPYPFKLGWRRQNKELLSFLNTTIV